MKKEANKRRKSIKLANKIDVENCQTIILTGAVHEVCKETFSETVKSLSSGEIQLEFQDAFSNTVK